MEQGNVAPNLLLHQFIHGNLGHYQREVLLNVLKVVQTKGGLGPVPSGPGGPGGPLGPPRPNQQQPPPPQAHQKASHPLLPQAPPQVCPLTQFFCGRFVKKIIKLHEGQIYDSFLFEYCSL